MSTGGSGKEHAIAALRRKDGKRSTIRKTSSPTPGTGSVDAAGQDGEIPGPAGHITGVPVHKSFLKTATPPFS